ncbi:dihydroneopterin aldolase [Flavobacteriaceae bacterium UJ101]|nr:dihydroneopterin aldolase [Flavobacteriaceae bacterium UJ101]
MNRKNVTYLSLGSNLGNKKENIEEGIKLIKESVGEIIQISNYYISESWGFKSEDFLNNIIEVETRFAPLQLFNRIKLIEEKLGAFHNSYLEGYQSRIIDIDVIYYNNFLYNQKLLSIPHLNMHNRKFVLLPLLELNSDIKHPIFNKDVKELLKVCTDRSEVFLYEE